MSKLAIITDLGHSIAEINGDEHIVKFYVQIKDNIPGFNGQIECDAHIMPTDNANKVHDAYIDGVVNGALTQLGITLAQSDIVAPQFYRAP